MGTNDLHHFLLIYDTAARRLRELSEFDALDRAMAAFEHAERVHRGDSTVQVVLLGADSLNTIKVTHSNFFYDKPIEGLIRLALAG